MRVIVIGCSVVNNGAKLLIPVTEVTNCPVAIRGAWVSFCPQQKQPEGCLGLAIEDCYLLPFAVDFLFST